MSAATWSIRNPIPAILLFLLLTLAGLWSFRALDIQNFPDLDLPAVSVVLRLPGTAPAQLETEVARKVEDSIATLEGLQHLVTNITDGQVNIMTDFTLDRDLSDALLDVKDAVDRVRGDLPPDLEEPEVSKITIGPGGPILTYAIESSSMDEEALSWFTDDTVARTVLAVPGVGRFERVGGVQREVQVRVDPTRVQALDVTVADISRALKRTQQDASGGRGQLSGTEQGVRTIASARQATDLDELPIALADGRSVRLDQVAEVADSYAERTQAALLDGKPAVGFQVSRSKGYDETKIAKGVEAALAQLAKEHPDVKYQLVRSFVQHTENQFHVSMEMLYEGAILAVLVIWWFLRDWRATLIGASALPLSIIPTFAVMHWLGYALNGITMLALSVVVGILVDDAIVEVENIARHVREGKPVRAATEEAVEEIALAVIATTATLVVVFLPTAFMSGVPGLVFKQFGWTVVAAVIASLLVARLVTPMMAAWLVRPDRGHHGKGAWTERYLKIADWCLRHRLFTIVAGTLFFFGSLMLVPLLPTGFIPAGDEGNTSVSVELPPGSSLVSTVATAEEARRAIVDLPGIDHVFTTVGSSSASGGDMGVGEVRKGSLMVVLAERGHRPKQQEIEVSMRKRLDAVPGARFSIGADKPGQKLQIILASQDAQALTSAAHAVEADLRRLPYLGGVVSTASLERPEITVRPDLARAAERGVTTQAIGDTVRIATSGDFVQSLAKLNLDNRQVDIRVKVPEDVRTDMQAIADLRIPGRGGLVPLSSVASLSVESGPSQIDRYNRERQITISADLGGYPLGNAIAEAKKLPAVLALPSSVRWIDSGDAEFMAELFGGFGLAMLTGILCVYCVLVLLFRDWFQPVTILSAVPLSVGGAFVALLLARSELGLPSLIGLVMLLGIVTKNSILLVEYAVIGIRERGLSEHDALLDACRKRARPILMTSVAMIAGMLPLALGLVGDSSFRTPMAIAVIGGLVTSTALSLLVVPVVFTYLAGFERRLLGHGVTTARTVHQPTAVSS
jgi:multidrug efflux pump subunit AcrB